MSEKKIFTESELGIVSDSVTDDLRKGLTTHQKSRLFDEQNKFFEGFGYKDTQNFIDQCNHGKIMVMTLEQFKTYSNFENEINRLEKIETKYNLLNEEFQYMGYDDINDFLRKWIDENKIDVVKNSEPFCHNNVNKYKAENFELKQQIIELKQQNKQLCKDAESFLKKKDSTNKIFQDLEFIKKIINTLQKDYNKSESKNDIIE